MSARDAVSQTVFPPTGCPAGPSLTCGSRALSQGAHNRGPILPSPVTLLDTKEGEEGRGWGAGGRGAAGAQDWGLGALDPGRGGLPGSSATGSASGPLSAVGGAGRKQNKEALWSSVEQGAELGGGAQKGRELPGRALGSRRKSRVTAESAEGQNARREGTRVP